MKIIHTADWHLGNSFYRNDRTPEFEHFLSSLLEVLAAEQPDALLISGDVFDVPNPSATATRLFYSFLRRATQELPGLQMVITAGNHDSGYRLEAPQEVLKDMEVHLLGRVHRNEEGEIRYDDYLIPLKNRTSGQVEMVALAIPFLRSGDYALGLTPEAALRDWVDRLLERHAQSAAAKLPVIGCAHYYMARAQLSEEHSERLIVGGQDAVEADLFGRRAAYVALGHIHRYQQVGERTWYAGSSLPMSFTERHYQHGVNVVTFASGGEPTVRQVAIAPLRRLQSIPERGEASPEEVVRLVEALPTRTTCPNMENWPYLEIKIHEERPEPTLLEELIKVLEDKAVLLCRITKGVKRGGALPATAPQLVSYKQFPPDELAEKIYRERYNSEMPEGMKKRFMAAMQQVESQMTAG